MKPPSLTPEFMRRTSRAVYQAMSSIDENAVWLLQGWTFAFNTYWTADLMKAWFNGMICKQ